MYLNPQRRKMDSPPRTRKGYDGKKKDQRQKAFGDKYGSGKHVRQHEARVEKQKDKK